MAPGKKLGRRVRRRHTPVHAVNRAPGTLIAREGAAPPRLRVVAYGPDRLVEEELADVADVQRFLDEYDVTWLNVDGVGHVETVRALGQAFGLHRLALEDVVNVQQRPKVEDYGAVQYVVARMLTTSTPGASGGRSAPLGRTIESEQLSLFLGDGWLVTAQERAGDCFDGVRERLRAGTGLARRAGADYLAYALLDAVVDGFFPVIEALSDRLEDLEEDVLTAPTERTMAAIQHAKRDVLTVRRVAWPQREALATLMRGAEGAFKPETLIHLRDCQDHAVQVIDLLETQRELASGLLDIYLSVVSNRMNEIMKVLTIVATIFIPLSFVSGLYGMNFDPSVSSYNMPELGWRFGYPYALGLMAVTAAAFLWWFRRRGWLGGRRRERSQGSDEAGRPAPAREPAARNATERGEPRA